MFQTIIELIINIPKLMGTTVIALNYIKHEVSWICQTLFSIVLLLSCKVVLLSVSAHFSSVYKKSTIFVKNVEIIFKL